MDSRYVMTREVCSCVFSTPDRFCANREKPSGAKVILGKRCCTISPGDKANFSGCNVGNRPENQITEVVDVIVEGSGVLS